MVEEIKCTNISKKFGNKTILNKITLSIYKNEIYGVVGKNGVGKTTLLKILAGLIYPSTGSVTIKTNIGIILNDPYGFYPRLTGMENLKFFAVANNISNNTFNKYVKKFSDLLNIKEYLNIRFQNYSAGTKQKLAIIRTLIINKEILLMDEPTKGLDRETIDKLSELIRSEKKTMVIATTNIEYARQICTKISELKNGTLTEI